MKEIIDILLVGNGGRDSAIARQLVMSPRLGTLYSTSPNISTGVYCKIDPSDNKRIADFVNENKIDLVIIGQANQICAGLPDYLIKNTEAHVTGPDRMCSQLESSKEFAKEFMSRHAIPTARFMTVTAETLDEGMDFLDSMTAPYVLKADGLADGRGVLIVDSLADAKDSLDACIMGKFGKASETVVIEEFLPGDELTVIVAIDGSDYVLLPTSKDYKRLLDGNVGPNTAGMGAISPSPTHDREFLEMVEKQILVPTLRGFKEEDMEYQGFLYLGVINVYGQPMLLEYNVRLGDPEAQAVLPRLETDFIDLLEAMTEHTLRRFRLEVSPQTCVAIVLAEEGYPGYYDIGFPVAGLGDVKNIIFTNGIRRKDDGTDVTSAGRVATVAAMDINPDIARMKALEDAECVKFEGKYFRRDIGS